MWFDVLIHCLLILALKEGSVKNVKPHWCILQKVLIRNSMYVRYLLFHIELPFHNANQRQHLNFPIWIKDRKTVRKLIGGYVDGIFPA